MRRRPPHSGKRLAGRSPERVGAPSAFQPDVEQLTAYLDMLAGAEPPDALLEIRLRYPKQQPMRRWFVEVGARRCLATQLPLIAARADVYLGCTPRQMRSGTREAVDGGWVAWADVDGPDGARRLSGLTPEPTLIVASGSPGATHAYWRLANRADVATLEELNRRLAQATGGDPVWAATSILRPPGTYNHKHDPPAPVRRIGGSGIVYEPGQLRDALPPVPLPPLRSSRAPRSISDDPLLAIPPRVYVERLLGVEVPRSGFVSCPLHVDRTPSLKVYETPERGWMCFSARCRRGGSIYDLAAAFWGLGTCGQDFLELRRRLLASFPNLTRQGEDGRGGGGYASLPS
jgi:hypothetical protein